MICSGSAGPDRARPCQNLFVVPVAAFAAAVCFFAPADVAPGAGEVVLGSAPAELLFSTVVFVPGHDAAVPESVADAVAPQGVADSVLAVVAVSPGYVVWVWIDGCLPPNGCFFANNDWSAIFSSYG